MGDAQSMDTLKVICQYIAIAVNFVPKESVAKIASALLLFSWNQIKEHVHDLTNLLYAKQIPLYWTSAKVIISYMFHAAILAFHKHHIKKVG
jgi:hypothetical protein